MVRFVEIYYLAESITVNVLATKVSVALVKLLLKLNATVGDLSKNFRVVSRVTRRIADRGLSILMVHLHQRAGLEHSTVARFATDPTTVVGMLVKKYAILKIWNPHHVLALLLEFPTAPAARLHKGKSSINLGKSVPIQFPIVRKNVPRHYVAGIDVARFATKVPAFPASRPSQLSVVAVV